MRLSIPALHTDKYQLTMMYAHWKNGSDQNRRAFDLYFRSLPFGNGFVVFAGLERVIQYLENLRFTEEDIEYIRSLDEGYEPEFLDLLRSFRFTGDLWAMPEGTIAFPNEPLLHVQGNIMELHLIETALLNIIGFQTLIATKAARIRHVAGDDLLMEFGTRRAQEKDAAVWGARAAYLSGFDSTSNMLAGQLFNIPISGTHAHSWVQDFDNELDAFRAYADAFPQQTTLLVDTYDTLRSGIPHAIQIGLEMKERNQTLAAIRLDSGDLAYLSKQARKMLDEAGLTETKIVASSDLDEHTILHLKAQGAKIDAWGVGTKLITAYDKPALGAVYKMVARYEGNQWIPTVKISSNPAKITTPGIKSIYRIICKQTGKAHADLISLSQENIDPKQPLILFHPEQTFKQKKVTNFIAVPMLQPIFRQGRRVYTLPSLEEIRVYHRSQLSLFWEEYLRIVLPEEYPVDLTRNLWEQRESLIKEIYSQIKKELEE